MHTVDLPRIATLWEILPLTDDQTAPLLPENINSGVKFGQNDTGLSHRSCFLSRHICRRILPDSVSAESNRFGDATE
jgi:hypothetical protein